MQFEKRTAKNLNGRLLRPFAGRRGVTLIELMLVLSVTGILCAIGLPQMSKLTSRTSTSRVAILIQADIEQAYTIAARLRKSVQIVATNGSRVYQIRDAVGGTVRLTRAIDHSNDLGVVTMSFYPTTVTIAPNGVASDTLGVTVQSRGSNVKVSMTRVGLVRRSY